MSAREIIINDKGSVTFTEDEAGGNKVSLTGPESIDADFTIKLPAAVGSGTTQFLKASTASTTTTLSFANHTEVGMTGVNVAAYGTGVIGNAGTDDHSDALNHSSTGAINASETSSQAGGNERIIFPAGVYNLKDIGDFDVSHSYWLEGSGMGATILKQVALEADTMMTAVGARILVFRNLTIDGNSLANTMLQATAPYIVLDNVEFTNCATALKIIGSTPKVISITNCRFVDMEANGVGPMVDINAVSTSGGFTLIFNNNYVEGATPGAAGTGTTGLVVTTGGTAVPAKCLIRGNEFRSLGKGDDGAIKITYGHDSVVSDNIFTNLVSTPIRFVDSKRITISGNKISSESSAVDHDDDVHGIDIATSSGAFGGVKIDNNTIVGTTNMLIGVKLVGSALIGYIEDISVSNNTIEGCDASLVLSNVRGKVDIVNNSINASLAAQASTFDRSAVHLTNIGGAAGSVSFDSRVNISNNVFDGGASSGRAIYFARGATNTGDVHVALRNNYINSMAQHSDYDLANTTDAALILINGHVDNKFTTVSASGNRYDFTDSQAIAYGMYVDNVAEGCIFDSIMEFGAIPDAATDSTVAINRAGLAAGVGGQINVPAGTFRVSDWGTMGVAATAKTGSATNTCIEVTADDQSWSGSGTIHDIGSSSDNAVFVVADAHSGVSISGIKFTHAGGTNTGKAIQAGTGVNFAASGCSTSAYKYGVEVAGPRSRVSGCNIGDPVAGAGIHLLATAVDSIVSGNSVRSADATGTDVGIKCLAVRVSINNNSIVNAAKHGVEVGPAMVGGCCQGNNIDMGSGTVDGSAIYLDQTSQYSVASNHIVGTGAWDTNQACIMLGAATAGCTHVSVIGNTIKSNQIGVDTESGGVRNCAISGNIIYVSASGSTENHGIRITGGALNAITGNTIEAASKGTTTAGIQLKSVRSTVSGNTIDYFQYGVELEGATQAHVVGNRMGLNVDTAVQETGTIILPVLLGNTESQDFAILGAQFLKLGSGAAVTSAVTSETIDATDSFIHVTTGGGAANIKQIKVNGNRTVHAESSSEADASAEYDGMLLLIHNSDAGNITIVPKSSGEDNIEAWTPAGDNIMASNHTLLFRFEHDGTNGYWRPIGDLTSLT